MKTIAKIKKKGMLYHTCREAIVELYRPTLCKLVYPAEKPERLLA